MEKMKEKLIDIIGKMSDPELQRALMRQGKRVPVNFYTRREVERRIIEEVEKRTDEEIQNFINNYFPQKTDG